MSTVTIGVGSLDEALDRFEQGWEGEKQNPHLSFETMELLWKTLTPRRFQMLQAMAGKEAMSLRALSRLVERDVKTVHGDVHALLKAGVMKHGTDGGVVFPYDAIHVDFTVTAAA